MNIFVFTHLLNSPRGVDPFQGTFGKEKSCSLLIPIWFSKKSSKWGGDTLALKLMIHSNQKLDYSIDLVLLSSFFLIVNFSWIYSVKTTSHEFQRCGLRQKIFSDNIEIKVFTQTLQPKFSFWLNFTLADYFKVLFSYVVCDNESIRVSSKNSDVLSMVE